VHLDFPGEALAVAFAEPGGAVKVRPMVLDTVSPDVAAPLWAEARVFLSWRVRFEPDRYATATILRRPGTGVPGAGPDAASIRIRVRRGGVRHERGSDLGAQDQLAFQRKAVARFRISRSWRRTSFSRRRRLSSAAMSSC